MKHGHRATNESAIEIEICNKFLNTIIFTFAVSNAIANIRILGSFKISHSSV